MDADSVGVSPVGRDSQSKPGAEWTEHLTVRFGWFGLRPDALRTFVGVAFSHQLRDKAP
jgi:hypothetical protein